MSNLPPPHFPHSPRPLHIGLDFDDTLMPTREALVVLLNQLHATDIRVQDCDDYYLFEPWRLTESQFHTMFNTHEESIHAQLPLEGALDTLRAWSPNARFTVITGRPECWIPSATRWLEQHQVPIVEIISAKSAGGKGAVARNLALDFFIEDHAPFAKEIADANIPVFLLDRPYNRSLAHPGITRVKDWHEIREQAATRFNLSQLSPSLSS